MEEYSTDVKDTKKNLKLMSKSGRSHKFRSSSRIVKYGSISFIRNVWLSIASVLVMTITLVILFITVIASMILNSTADAMREKIDITIFFKPGTSLEELNTMSATMQKNDNVKSVEVSTSEQEYQRFLEENADDEALMQTLSDPSMGELMVASMQATMRVKVNDINNLSSIESLVATDRLFIANLDSEKLPTYDMNRAEIETVTSWANIAKNGGIILSIVFLVISILVIFNTIRMAIFSRREEIYMEKLVGADNTFIRGPFLVEAQICGIISGILATTFGYAGAHIVAPHLSSYGIDVSAITDLVESKWLIMVYLIIVAIGMSIGTISAYLAIHKYLQMGAKRKKRQ